LAGGRGGPPWLRNNTTTTTTTAGQGQSAQATPQAQGQDQNAGQGQGQGQSQQTTPPSWWQTFDWSILLLIFGVLSISFTLIFMGFESLRNRPKIKPPEK